MRLPILLNGPEGPCFLNLILTHILDKGLMVLSGETANQQDTQPVKRF